MKVTLLEYQKKDPSRVSLYIDGAFFCGISLNTLAKYGLYDGKDVEQKVLDDLFFSELEGRFFERAASLLDHGQKTEKQLRMYLKDLVFKKKGKWFETLDNDTAALIVEKVVTKLKEYGYINDEKYAQEFVSSRMKSRPRGKDILIMELVSKGIDRQIAQEVVTTQVVDEYGLLDAVYKKKYKEEKLTFSDRKKIDFLKRKGFDWDLIEKYINNES